MYENERHHELAHFLRTRRERLSPQQIGLPLLGRRRTPGLRREEVALVSGVSMTWYTWLEQGRAIAVSDQVLESLARALQLNSSEQAYLFALAHVQPPFEPHPLTQTIDPTHQHILDAMGVNPAFILNYRWDVIAWNAAMKNMFGDLCTIAPEQNLLWSFFALPKFQRQVVDWERDAQNTLAIFRSRTLRYAGHTEITTLVDHLFDLDPIFHKWWSRYDVLETYTGYKQIYHPVVGLLVLQVQAYNVLGCPDLCMIVYVPATETDTSDKLVQLSNFAC